MTKNELINEMMYHKSMATFHESVVEHHNKKAQAFNKRLARIIARSAKNETEKILEKLTKT